MIHLNIKVCALSDPPAFPEFKDKAYNAEINGIAILEGGMASGKTSVSILAEDENGRCAHAQLSADLFQTAAAILKGAQERFGG